MDDLIDWTALVCIYICLAACRIIYQGLFVDLLPATFPARPPFSAVRPQWEESLNSCSVVYVCLCVCVMRLYLCDCAYERVARGVGGGVVTTGAVTETFGVMKNGDFPFWPLMQEPDLDQKLLKTLKLDSTTEKFIFKQVRKITYIQVLS